MDSLKKLKQYIDKFVEFICIVLMGIMTCLVVYQVLTRKIFNSPSTISESLSQYLFVWMVMLGSAYVFGLREHLSITLIKDKLSPRWNMVVEILISVTLILFSIYLLLYGGMKQTISQMRTLDAALQIPMGVIYSVIPVTGLFMLFYAGYNIALAISDYKDNKGGDNR